MADTDANSGAAGAQAGAASAGGAGGASGGGTGSPAWHANIAPEIKDFWAAKKYDLSDPAKLVDVVTRGYQNAEKFMGVPSEDLLRVPKPNADTNEINNFWNRIGVPKEAKDYDFANIKLSDGSELDPAFADAMRASLHSNRVAKENAPNIIRDVVKHLEANDKAALAESTAEIQKQEEALRTNWGNRYAYNLQVAKDALDRIGGASGLTKEQIDQGWDALSKVGGIGASYAMEMLRAIGARMGEAPFVSGGMQPGGDNNAVMSREGARARIAEIQRDDAQRGRILAGDAAANREWTQLHKILTGVQTTAA